MVNFSVFNELSLPLTQYKEGDTFKCFFKLLKKLKECYGISCLRTSDAFENYNILKDVSFKKFLEQQQDREFKTRLTSLITGSSVIESPLIRTEEEEQLDIDPYCGYSYNNQSINGGLACGDIWDTVVISFNSQSQWNKHSIELTKEILTDNDKIEKQSISIKHASNCDHLKQHQDFFADIEEENRRNITQNNFWDDRANNFPSKIEFCPEVESQILKLDREVFDQAVSILRNVETGRKKITDLNWSSESKTVKNNPKMSRQRMFTVDNKKELFTKHIKSLSHKHRMYFLEKPQKIYIGYIGPHLETATN